jgi:hypothetical protein
MAIILDGTLGLTAPAVVSNGSVTSQSTGFIFPNSTTQASSGVVLQVVNTNLHAGVASTITTPTASGLTATITPKFATSKILVCWQVNGCEKSSGATDGGVRFWLYKNGSNLFSSTAIDYAGYTNSSTTNDVGGVSMEILDSPATTSATTYAIYFGSSSSGISANINAGNDYSTMTLMEIAG